MTGTVVIAVDAMGGDHGPATTAPAVAAFLQAHPQVRVLLYGSAEALSQVPVNGTDRLALVECPLQVERDDRPAQALRHKRESSMGRALQAVASGDADACVSAGNTGAFMAMGIAALGTLPGIQRPAICTQLPTIAGRICLLDLGANVDCDAAQLHQFARMGAARLQAEGLERVPRVALLNVGVEAGKGNRVVKSAAELLAADPALDYQGFIEGDQLLLGLVDLVVCDGFVGNVALKSIEGLARLTLQRLEDARATALPWRRPAMGRMIDAALGVLDPAQYNGASLLGLRGVVIKSHGGADSGSFGCALATALAEVRGRLPQRIAEYLADPHHPSSIH